MINGENKRIFTKFCGELGTTSDSLQDIKHITHSNDNKQSNSSFWLKTLFYGLIIFYTLFMFPSQANAYYLNNSLADYENINVATIDDFINNCQYTTLVNFLNDNKDDYNMIIFYGGYYQDQFTVLCLNKNLTYHLISPSYFSNLREAYPSITVTPSTHLALYTNSTSDSDFKYVTYRTSNDSLSGFNSQTYHSYLNTFTDYNVQVEIANNIQLYNDTLYTNYGLKLYDNDTLNDLVISSEPIEEPSEPIEEPSEPIEDNTLIINLLFYIAFINTLGVLYYMIRNVFKRSWA